MRRAATWMSRSRWSAVKAATAAFEPACVHGAHQVNGARFADGILTAKELQVLLPS